LELLKNPNQDPQKGAKLAVKLDALRKKGKLWRRWNTAYIN